MIGRKFSPALLPLALVLAACGDTAGTGATATDEGEACEFPTGDIDLIVWSAAGGSGDTAVRLLGPHLEDALGTTVVVRNISGGGGVEAINYMLSQPPDGHTLTAVSGTLSTLFSEEGVEFTQEDIQPAVITRHKPFAIYVNSDSPYKSLQDLVEAGQSGEVVATGVFPIGGYRFAWERFAEAAEVQSTWVPFDGTPESVAAVVGGQVDAGVTYPGRLAPQLEANEVRILAVASEERLPAFPDIPTLKELDYDLMLSNYEGIVARQGMCSEALDAITGAFDDALASDDWQELLESTGTSMGTTDPAEYTRILQEDADFTVELKERLGLQ